jgi:hypothetical protein
MDSFITTTPVIIDTPTDREDGGGSGNAYCVVAKSESIPTNEETTGGSGNAYCVVA